MCAEAAARKESVQRGRDRAFRAGLPDLLHIHSVQRAKKKKKKRSREKGTAITGARYDRLHPTIRTTPSHALASIFNATIATVGRASEEAFASDASYIAS